MPIFQYFRRKWILRRPFPEQWRGILHTRVPVWPRLPEKQKENLEKLITLFLDDKIFEGCGGLRVTEEHRIVIAAYACLLLLGEEGGIYPDLKVILLYPDDYIAPVHDEGEGGIVTEGSESRKGESWNLGNIVLSWADIERNLYRQPDGNNLILHEFAHPFDDRYGLTSGIGEDGTVHTPNEWNNTLAHAYLSLQRSVARGRTTVLDPYGAEQPAELFAVAVEAFVERPQRLKREAPALYNMLQAFFQIDPAGWGASG